MGKSSIGKAWDRTLGNKGVGGWVGDRFKSPSRPSLDQSKFNISEQAKKYTQIANEQTARNAAMNQELADTLRKRVEAGPTLANAQLRAGQEQNLAQTLAAAASARQTPLNQALALRAQSAGGQQLAQQNMAAGLQEQMQAQNQLGQQLGRQGQTAVEDLSSAFNIAYSPETLKQQGANAATQADLARSLAQTQQQNQLFGGLLGAAGQIGAGMLKTAPQQPNAAGGSAGTSGGPPGFDVLSADIMSDESQKENIESAQKPISSFLDKLVAMEYDYKDTSKPGTAPGRQYGIMAQDLEKSEVGKTMVTDTPHGKMVDTARGFGAVLAAQSELNRRIKKLESRKG